MNVIAGAAITFKKAAEPRFGEYAGATLRNSTALATALLRKEGDDTDHRRHRRHHRTVIDTIASFGLDGRAAEEALDAIGITANKQIVPRLSAPAPAPQRDAPRRSGLHHARNEQGGHDDNRAVDRQDAALP